MFLNVFLPLAQAAKAAPANTGAAGEAWLRIGLTAMIFVVAYFLGRVLSRRFRMPDHGWKISLTTFTILAGLVITALHTFVWRPDLKLADTKNDAQVSQAVSRQAEEVRSGEWIIGEGLSPEELKEAQAQVVHAAPNNPVLLIGKDGKQAWANPRALQVADLTNPQTKVEGVARDAEGNPTGMLEGPAVNYVHDLAPPEFTVQWPTPLGIELSGGTILVYEIDPAQAENKKVDLDELIGAVRRRIDPGNTKQITLRPYGRNQIEIIIPKVSHSEIEQIKRRITNLGTLEFRIVANMTDDANLIKRAKLMPLDQKILRDPTDGKELARWVPFDPATQDLHSFMGSEWAERSVNPKLKLSDPDIKPADVEILMRIDEFNVNGGYLANSEASYDQRDGKPSVAFTFDSAGARRFAALTKRNLPRPNRPENDNTAYRYLGIILDGKLFSAPRINGVISNRGEITGAFTRERRDALLAVLNAGRLPAQLNESPISEWDSDATLGADTVRRGSWAMIASILAVLVFMALYYRFAGLVACFALLANLVLILGVMIALNAALTLPGLAGLVLTVGMAVDANVLIYERIREEMDRGTALRMAIRNGFSRATTTIIDANVTTLITAVVLYAMGTDQIKGFAVVLILGIAMSMFTAIFMARLIFDIAEKRRWISDLKMFRLLKSAHIDFIGKRGLAAAASLTLIVIGMAAVYMRGRNLLDIDFTGGTSAQVVFNSANVDGKQITVTFVRSEADKWSAAVEAADTPEALGKIIGARLPEKLAHELAKDIVNAEIRTAGESQAADEAAIAKSEQAPAASAATTAVRVQRETERLTGKPLSELTPSEFAAVKELADLPDVAISEIEPIEGENARKRFYINTSNRSIDAVEFILETLFKTPTGGSLLASNAMHISDVNAAAPESTDAEEETPPEGNKPPGNSGAALQPPASLRTTAEGLPTQFISMQAAGDAAGQSVAPDSNPPLTAPESDPLASTPGTGEATTARLTFDEPISHNALSTLIAAHLDQGVPFKVSNPDYKTDSTMAFETWYVRLNVPPAIARPALQSAQQDIASQPLFPASNNIGTAVAASVRGQAVAALLASLVGIVIYIWIRFNKVSFGLAAVVALVHDVLITLGFLALSAYLAGVPYIDPFKISLQILAAFLTIVGYSLNDTIVVFDRIREVRGKAPELTADMVNLSINQTLSRTLLTSFTTLLVVMILFFFGGQGIHGFAYALVIGVVVGTYSSIFVASPILLWLIRPSGQRKSASQAASNRPQPTGV